ncbi:MAG: pectate lyase family protein [Planctomycetota bacterium]|jgi:hypothetical protein
MNRQIAVLLITLANLSVAESSGSVPAFPGAEGFGAQSLGGRGGEVLFVTNLNDSGPGSLRAAVEADGPRTVIFRVSGTIALKSTLGIRNSHITIAGQSAPGDGICLKNYGFSIAADHVIVRYLRCRPANNAGAECDAMSISRGRDIIVDHCSASWSVDETLSASTSRGLGNVTVQWCIISESLNKSTHHKGAHGYGALIRGGWGEGYTYHHNLFAHHKARLPRPGNYNDRSEDPEGFIFDFRNNVIYNWGGSAAGYNADGSNGVSSITKMNFVGNYYKRGVDSSGDLAFSESTRSAKAWFSGNCMNGDYPAEPWSLVTFSKFSPRDIQAYIQTEPILAPPVKTDDAVRAYERILAESGAVLPKRDAVDLRVVADVRNGSGRIIDDEDEVGGWPELKFTEPPKDADRDGMPDEWEDRHGLDAQDPADRNADADADGYTNLEEYLNSI